MITPLLLAGPAVEPVSLAEIKAYLKIDAADEDALLSALIPAARLTVEAVCGRILVNQQWRLVMDAWPRGGQLRVPLSPFGTVEAIRVFDAAGVPALVDPSAYDVDAQAVPGRIRFRAQPPAPGRALSGIEIDVLAGYGAAAGDVPEALRLAVKRLATHWFERRGEADGLGDAPAVPPDVAALVAPFRGRRL